jgi:c-di-AMP phosphodiesterase-like protein
VDEARQVLERVRERLAERTVVADLPPFTVSFGLASSDQAAAFDEVVALADAALLRAKAGGRDQVVVSDGAAGREKTPADVAVRLATRSLGNGDSAGTEVEAPQRN